VAVSAAQHVAGCAVDQEQALNKTTEHQRAKSGKQQLNVLHNKFWSHSAPQTFQMLLSLTYPSLFKLEQYGISTAVHTGCG